MQAGITQDSTMNKLILLFVFDKMETALSTCAVIKTTGLTTRTANKPFLTLWITDSYTKARRWAAETSYSI